MANKNIKVNKVPTTTSKGKTPSTTRQHLNEPEEDFLSKYGKSIVVIIFSILSGDALPIVLQKGLEPDQIFYTIVLVTLPYSTAMTLIFLMWMLEEMDTFTDVLWGVAASGFLLALFLWLAACRRE